MDKKIEERVKAIYNDCWKSYKQYTADHDMSEFNERVVGLKKEYGEDRFLRNILYAFAPIINSLHAEFLMKQEGKK